MIENQLPMAMQNDVGTETNAGNKVWLQKTKKQKQLFDGYDAHRQKLVLGPIRKSLLWIKRKKWTNIK